MSRYDDKNWAKTFRNGELINLELFGDDSLEIRYEPITKEELLKFVHDYVNGSWLLWSDGHHEEPATVVYLTNDTIIHDLTALVTTLRSGKSYRYWRVEIEDCLL